MSFNVPKGKQNPQSQKKFGGKISSAEIPKKLLKISKEMNNPARARVHTHRIQMASIYNKMPNTTSKKKGRGRGMKLRLFFTLMTLLFEIKSAWGGKQGEYRMQY